MLCLCLSSSSCASQQPVSYLPANLWFLLPHSPVSPLSTATPSPAHLPALPPVCFGLEPHHHKHFLFFFSKSLKTAPECFKPWNLCCLSTKLSVIKHTTRNIIYKKNWRANSNHLIVHDGGVNLFYPTFSRNDYKCIFQYAWQASITKESQTMGK